MLDLNQLGSGNIHGISPPLGTALAEAGGVCLESQGHAVGVVLSVRGYSDNKYRLSWVPITEQSHRSWNDPELATEFGAVGVAALLIMKETGYTVIESSRKGTGFDYWLGSETDELPMNGKARLEISGIRQGDDQAVKQRTRRKLKQTSRSDELLLPAFVIVVEFGRPLAEVSEK